MTKKALTMQDLPTSDAEEVYFYKLNRELIEKQKQKRRLRAIPGSGDREKHKDSSLSLRAYPNKKAA